MRVIVIGGGATIYFLARQFIANDYHVTVVNRDAGECDTLARSLQATVVHGDGSDPHVLEEAGARRADVVLALTSHDEDNLVTCQLAQRLYGVPRTIAIVNDPENEEIFHQLGVTVAFSPTRIIANLLEEQTGFEEIAAVMPLEEGKVTISEVVMRKGAPAIGQSLMELALPAGVLVGGIMRNDQVTVPSGATTLHVGDRLILISRPEQHAAALRALTGEMP